MEYKGYTITQSSCNHHIMISRDGKAVSHISCNEKKSDEELKEIADFILERIHVRRMYDL